MRRRNELSSASTGLSIVVEACFQPSDINKLAVDLDEALGTFRTFALTGYDEKLFPSILHLNINTITAKDAGTWIILYLALM